MNIATNRRLRIVAATKKREYQMMTNIVIIRCYGTAVEGRKINSIRQQQVRCGWEELGRIKILCVCDDTTKSDEKWADREWEIKGEVKVQFSTIELTKDRQGMNEWMNSGIWIGIRWCPYPPFRFNTSLRHSLSTSTVPSHPLLLCEMQRCRERDKTI